MRGETDRQTETESERERDRERERERERGRVLTLFSLNLIKRHLISLIKKLKNIFFPDSVRIMLKELNFSLCLSDARRAPCFPASLKCCLLTRQSHVGLTCKGFRDHNIDLGLYESIIFYFFFNLRFS